MRIHQLVIAIYIENLQIDLHNLLISLVFPFKEHDLRLLAWNTAVRIISSLIIALIVSSLRFVKL